MQRRKFITLLDAAFAGLPQQSGTALVLSSDAFLYGRRGQIATLAFRIFSKVTQTATLNRTTHAHTGLKQKELADRITQILDAAGDPRQMLGVLGLRGVAGGRWL